MTAMVRAVNHWELFGLNLRSAALCDFDYFGVNRRGQVVIIGQTVRGKGLERC